MGRDSHPAFRLGATDEIKNSGTTLATMLKSGTWLAASYRNYLDIQAGDAINISTLLSGSLSPDSEDGDPAQTRTKRHNQKTLRKRARMAPIAFLGKLDSSKGRKKRKTKKGPQPGVDDADSDTSSEA